jgi:predicted alpha-1,6-mannanase (GH76 family)
VRLNCRRADFFARVLIDLPANRPAGFIAAFVPDDFGDLLLSYGQVEEWQFKREARNEADGVLLRFEREKFECH